MKVKRNAYFRILLGMVVLCTSCKNNRIYFDLANQTINTCNGGPIFTLFISKKDNKKYGHYTKIQDQDGTARFKIHAPNPGYVFDPGSSDVTVFTFDPNSEFSIENISNGDAASFEIEFKTDAKGKVVSASVTDCP